MHRHKQFCYEGGIRTPLIVAGPGIPAGALRDDLVSGIDVGPASLALAEIEIPPHMEGRDLFAKDHEPREFVVSARDRCDYTIDRIRAVVTKRWKYIRNFLTDRPYMQPQYRDPWPLTKELRRMAAEGELSKVQMRFYGDDRPAEELYDLENDPDEIDNLADDPGHAKVLDGMRLILERWMSDTGDQGRRPESEAGLKAALERWGRRCVNPEYEPLKKKYPHLLEEEKVDK
jgi:arylsulfatase A-like enzyme